VNLAIVDGAAAAADQRDAGVLRLPTGACSAVASQRIRMPRYREAGPLVAQILYRDPGPVFFGAGPAFGIGRVWDEYAPGGFDPMFRTIRRCLGAGHYAPASSTGRGVEVDLSVGRTLTAGCGQVAVEVDRFEILQAAPGECPELGQVVNGLAEQDGGWKFGANEYATAGFAAGVGEGGSRAGKLALRASCGSAGVAVPFSSGLVDPTGSPALSFYVSSTANVSIEGNLGLPVIAGFPGGPPTTVHICLPASLRGVTSELSISPFPTGNTPCDAPIDASAILDSVKLESTPACGTDPAIADPGFESGYLSAIQDFSSAGSVRPIEDAGARSGARMLEMKVSTCSGQARAYVSVIVPSPSSDAGPALRLWSRRAGDMTAALYVSKYDGSGAGLQVPYHPVWGRDVMCLDPKLAGRSQGVMFTLQAPEYCPGPLPDETAYLDDLEVTTDPSCPAM
jgi:hypothetical protein